MAASNAYLRPEVLARITKLSLRTQRVVEGVVSGRHRSPMHGMNVEFADYREYAPGDDLKRLDWRVYGRANRFYIKQYEEESNLRATLLLDASASMGYQSARAPLSKYDYAATLAASLATLLIKQRDAVGLAVFDREQRHWLPPVATNAQLAKIIDTLESAAPDRQTELGETILRLSDQIKKRGMVLVISDLLTDLDRFYDGIGKLRYLGHDTVVFHILDRDELELSFTGSVIFRDIEGSDEVFAEPQFFRQAYRHAMQQFCANVERRCRAASVDYVRLFTDSELGSVLSHYLHLRQPAGSRPAGPS